MKQFTYLAIDLGCLLVPFLASLHPKLPFYKHWSRFFLANIIVTILFLIWDEIFTRNGVWGFNPDYTTGIYLSHLPLEEVMFFFCIPYACTFSYFAIYSYINKNPLSTYHRQINWGLSLILLFIGLFFLQKLYTSVTFLLTTALLFYVLYKKINISYIFLTYIFVFPFFLASNGLLTGTYLAAPIVWYNNAENLGIRLLTIPIEDTMYGFLMIALNILLTFPSHFTSSASDMKK